MVSFIKASGSNPKKDLIELWKRLVFIMAVFNTDDHRRNHGFILEKTGWRLSPLYDVNPVPEGDELALCVNKYNPTISVALALETAPYYGLAEKEARRTANEMTDTVRGNWERLVATHGLSRSAIEFMRPAFSACYGE